MEYAGLSRINREGNVAAPRRRSACDFFFFLLTIAISNKKREKKKNGRLDVTVVFIKSAYFNALRSQPVRYAPLNYKRHQGSEVKALLPVYDKNMLLMRMRNKKQTKR